MSTPSNENTTAATTGSSNNKNKNSDDDSCKKMDCGQLHWFAIMAFSIIALSGLVTNYPTLTDSIGDQTKEVKWVVSAMSIAISFAAISFASHLWIKDKFMNTNLETGMATFTMIFWSAAMPYIMDPDQNLAVETYFGGISKPNVYFFSWAAFLVTFYHFFTCACHTIRTMMKSSSTGSTTESTTEDHRCSHSLWAGLMASSFVVMIASSRAHKDLNCVDGKDSSNYSYLSDDVYDAVCGRTIYGIALGVISSLVGVFWLVGSMFWMKGTLGTTIEFGLVLMLWMMWMVGVVLLTFDQEKSPGTDTGNIYFFSWGSWSLTIYMLMMSFQNLMMTCDKHGTGKSDAVMNKPTMERVNDEEQVTSDDVLSA